MIDRRKAIIVALIVMVVFLPGGLFFQARYQEKRIVEYRDVILDQVTPYSFLLTNSLTHRLMLVESLSAYLNNNLPGAGEFRHDDLDRTVEGLRLTVTGVESISIAPNGINEYVYPIRGNETEVGKNVAAGMGQQEFQRIQQAIDNKGISLGIPYKSSTGSLQITAYKALYEGEKYWGLITLRINLQPVFVEAGLENIPPDLLLGVLDGQNDVIWGEPAVIGRSPERIEVDLRSETWTIAASPKQSWEDAVSPIVIVFRIILGAVIAFLVTISYYLTRREQRLSENVRAKNAELQNALTIQQEIERDAKSTRNIFQYILDHLPVGVLVITPEGTRLLENPHSREIWEDTDPSAHRTPDEYKGRKLDSDEFVSGETWPAYRVFEEQKPILNELFTIETFAGNKKIISNSAVPIPGSDGKIEAVAVLIQDITEFRQKSIELQKLNRLLTMTSMVNKAMVRTSDEKELIKEVCQIMVEAGGYSQAWVGTIDEKTKIMSPVASYGDFTRKIPEILATADDNVVDRGPISKAIITGETTICPDISSVHDENSWRKEALQCGFNSLISIPLKFDQKIHGALTLFSTNAGKFDETEVDYLEDLAQDLIYGLVSCWTRRENQRANAKIEDLSHFPSEDPNPVARLDTDGKLLYTNEAGGILLRNWNLSLGDSIPGDWKEIIQQAAQKSEPQVVQTQINDGIYLISIVPVLSKNYVNLYGRDVSDLIEAQSKLEVSLQKLEEAQRLAHIGLWETTSVDRLTFWSDEVFRIFELPLTKTPPPFEEMYHFFTPEDGEWLQSTFVQAWQEKNEFSIDIPINFPDGRVKYVNLMGHPVSDDSGQKFYLAGTILDITERESIRLRTQHLNEELEKRVKQRTEQLEIANKELETFSYSVSHDLKAPLRGIDGYCRLLLEDYYSTLDETGQHYLNSVRKATDNMNRLIEDILAYSRLERRSFGKNRVDLSPILQTVLYDLDLDIKQKGVTVNVDLQPGEILADADGLKVTVRNLVENAVKFSSKVASPLVEISGQIRDNDYWIIVKDNGIGFDMKYQEKIFDMFQRLTRVEDYPGTGVGLAIVRKAVQRMDGKIWAESAPGRGATFYLSIPRYQENSGEEKR